MFNRGGMVRATAGADASVTLAGNATFQWDGVASFDPASGTLGSVRATARREAEDAAWAAVLAGL